MDEDQVNEDVKLATPPGLIAMLAITGLGSQRVNAHALRSVKPLQLAARVVGYP